MAGAFHSDYQRRLRTPAAAAALLRPADTIAVPIATGQPAAFLAALGERADWTDLVLFGGLFVEPYSVAQRPGVRCISGFYGPVERMMVSAGARLDYLPADFLGWERYARVAKPRVMATNVAPIDERGFFSLGLHAGATFNALLSAAHDTERLAIVEVVRDMPHVYGLGQYGGHRIHVSEVDCVIESDRAAFTLPEVPPADEDAAIAAHVAALIEDGATLQFGIGAIPNRVGQILAAGDKGDLGVHTEMFVDGIMHLHQAGKVSNHKGVFDGFSIATFAAGSAELYRWLHRNPEVRMLPVAEVNDPAIIRRNRRMVSINGALAVDLSGQVMADTIGPRQYSGVGGHELFVIGAHDCPDGKSIIAVRSTATVKGQRVSTIVDALPGGTPVTTPRHHVQYVVTEHGVANLGMLTARERVHALSEIAHPDFRDQLRAAERAR
jgi:acyl-CoA hydrolase